MAQRTSRSMPADAASRSPTRTRCSSPRPATRSSTSCNYYLAVARRRAPRRHARGRWCSSASPTAPTASRSSRSARRTNRPDWIETALITFPSGRSADLVVCDEPSDLAWVVNLGCIDLNPWPVRADDVDHPDELRVDLDPTPEATSRDVRAVALGVREVLDDLGHARLSRRRRARAASTSTCASSRSGGSPTCAAARWRSGARWSAACPALATTAVVEGGAPRRLHRLQPERARPHRGLGLLRAPDAGRARVVPARVGRGAGRRPGDVHHRDRARALRQRGDPGADDRRRAALARAAARPRAARRRRRARATRRGRRSSRRRAGEPPRVQPSKRRRPT